MFVKNRSSIVAYKLIFCVCEIFSDSILLRSGSGTVTLNGTVFNYNSGSAKAKSYGSYGSGSTTLHSTERLV